MCSSSIVMVMKCPVCQQTLVGRDGVFVCPSSHGTLIPGKLLGSLKQINIDDTALTTQHKSSNHQILCPHCGHTMQKSNYNSTGIIIDACVNCPYRWLDAGEVKKIKDFKPKLDPESLLYLLGFENQIKASKAADNMNPDVPLSDGVAGGIIKGGIVAGDDNRTLGYLLGAGLYGLIVGIIKSKFIRILSPFIILFFIILFYLLLKQINAINWSGF